MRSRSRVVVFGESTRGLLAHPYQPRDLLDLELLLGHPPEGSQGLYLATQTMLLEHELLFFRVDEEGFSPQDYWMGARVLSELSHRRVCFDAVGLPGVGDAEIIAAVERSLLGRAPLLLMNERDLYDFLSSSDSTQ